MPENGIEAIALECIELALSKNLGDDYNADIMLFVGVGWLVLIGH